MEEEPELGGASELFPLTSQPTMYSLSSVTYGHSDSGADSGAPPFSSPATVSSGLLRSNFGMTSLEKNMGNGKEFGTRRDEALEAFLKAFQMSAMEGRYSCKYKRAVFPLLDILFLCWIY